MVFQLLPDLIQFPDPALAEDDGLLAYGGDLSEARLRLAYSLGIFPWYSEGDAILWYAPHERCVIFPEKIKVSKSMSQLLKKDVFHITSNQNFEAVILSCARVPRKDQDGTWITNDMQNAYINLHKKGVAHSVEVWQEGRLVGGLYGIIVNHVFCGESMFSLVPNASKAALIWLSRNPGLKLIDCQLPNQHLLSMGAEMIDSGIFRQILKA
jgi:leucyl/phenylalanyl-tRNA--protein transferase